MTFLIPVIDALRTPGPRVPGGTATAWHQALGAMSGYPGMTGSPPPGARLGMQAIAQTHEGGCNAWI